MKDVKEFLIKASLGLGIIFSVFTCLDGLFFGWNHDTTIYASIAVISLLIFLGLELYFGPDDDDI